MTLAGNYPYRNPNYLDYDNIPKKEVKKYKMPPEQEIALRERLVFFIAGMPVAFERIPVMVEQLFQYIVNGPVDKSKEDDKK